MVQLFQNIYLIENIKHVIRNNCYSGICRQAPIDYLVCRVSGTGRY